MTSFLGPVRKAGSFIAGLLVGISIVVAAFALTDMDSNAWRTVLAFGAPVVLAFGLALQVVVTARPGRPMAARVAAAPPRFPATVNLASTAAAMPATSSGGPLGIGAAT